MTRPKLELVELSTLAEYPGNPRRGNVEAIRASLRANHQFQPLVVQRTSSRVLSGNHTLQAMRAEGWHHADVYLVDVDDETARRIVLAANRTADLGTYDDGDLLALLQSVESLDGTGYGEDDLAALLAPADDRPHYDLEQADRVPALPADPRARPGDLWRLGEHRLVCGDARQVGALQQACGLDRADVLWTDPPYGVEYVGGTGLTIQNDDPGGLAVLLDHAFHAAAQALKPGAPAYVAHSDTRRVTFQGCLEAAGFTVRQNLVWVKNALVLGRSDYQYRHEPILEAAGPTDADPRALDDDPESFTHEPVLYGFREGGAGRLGRGGPHWYGDNRQTTVFQVKKPTASRQHPTMKPTELVVAMLRNSLPKGGLVLDPFAGSGSTLVAADMLGARAALVELDPRYVDVIVDRYRQLRPAEPVRLVRDHEEVPA